jgi:hypothetical protein
MSASDPHAVRNGVLTTIVGGIAMAALSELWPPAKGFMLAIWEYFLAFVGLLTISYSVQGWLLAILSIVALITVFRFIVGFLAKQSPSYVGYIEDQLFGAKWRWSWVAGEIANLWCFCPRCDLELVYDDSHDIYSHVGSRTDFKCEHCNHATVATITGGDKRYALSAVRREIHRKVRISAYPSAPQPGS